MDTGSVEYVLGVAEELGRWTCCFRVRQIYPWVSVMGEYVFLK